MSRFLVGLTPHSEVLSSGESRQRIRGSALQQRCRVCQAMLTTAASRKMGRHPTCASSYDEQLLEKLKAWRKQAAEGAPAFVVFTDATLVAIAEALPSTDEELLAISGVGPSKLERWGKQVIELIDDHRGITEH